ncbi:MAG: MobV family relaxase [Rikenellaceae bacterium]
MGYAVVHLAKAKGSDSGTSAHIERKVDPKNADKERTHLNKELIDFPDGVENRTQAIQYRLDNAGLTRKIGTNQVRAIRIMLTGTHEDMIQIEESANLDNWCNDNLDWLNKTYGNDNVVSAVLHLDEKTPHIHATVVPIVETERKRRKREEAAKRKYRAKAAHTARLCADEVMSRAKLKEYQNSYAEAMKRYGLERGIDGSEAKHITTSQYYRDLKVQSESIQEDISELKEQKKRADKELSEVKTDISKERLRNSAADVGSKILDSASSFLGTSRVKKMENEIEYLKNQVSNLEESNTQISQNLESERASHQQEIDSFKQESKQQEESLKSENKRLKDQISKIFDLFPTIKELLNLENFIRKVGFGTEMIRRLFNREEVQFHGSIYSHEYNRKFETKGSTAKIAPDPTCDNRPSLYIDNQDHIYWFRQKKREELKAMGIDLPEPRQQRKMRI